jgi:hypothetical protein
VVKIVFSIWFFLSGFVLLPSLLRFRRRCAMP